MKKEPQTISMIELWVSDREIPDISCKYLQSQRSGRSDVSLSGTNSCGTWYYSSKGKILCKKKCHAAPQLQCCIDKEIILMKEKGKEKRRQRQIRAAFGLSEIKLEEEKNDLAE